MRNYVVITFLMSKEIDVADKCLSRGLIYRINLRIVNKLGKYRPIARAGEGE